MNRLLTYTVTDQEDNLRVSQFLKRKGFSRQNMIELKKIPFSIQVNHVMYYLNQRVFKGDKLSVSIQETKSSAKIPPIPLPIDIIYEDEELMVLNKAAKMPTHPSQKNYTNSLANGLAWYFQQQGKPFIFRCTNRLDRDTSGLTIVSKHLVSASIIASMAVEHKIEREYLAIVSGCPAVSAGTITAPLGRKAGSIIERTVDWEDGKQAVTHYRVLRSENGHSLLSIQLETGRTHQIRIHLKHLGCPIIGDYLYNPNMELIDRQALHSARLSFVHPFTGMPMEFTAPLPDDMSRIIRLNG